MVDYGEGFKNSQHLRCPECKSKNYLFEAENDRWICWDCGEKE